MSVRIPKICVECDEKGTHFFILNKILCNYCRQLDRYTVITKPIVKKEYFLRDDDMYDLHSYELASKNGPITYYIKSDVIGKACQKYDATPKELTSIFQEIIEKKNTFKEINKNKRLEKEKIKQDKRKDELLVALNNAGLELDCDRMICENYIMGDKEYTLDKVIERMCQLKYLYEFCHMDECRRIVFREHKEERKNGYYHESTVAERAEKLALDTYSNGQYPDVYPWQIV